MKTVFDKFGGIRPMAAKLGVPSSTVKSWHVNGHIPAWRHTEIIQAALAHGVSISTSDLTALQPVARSAA